MTDEFDVVVIGGGPAGVATAIELASHGRLVAIVESSTYRDVRIGEHLAPQGTALLARLSASEQLTSPMNRACSGLVSAWGTEQLSSTDYIFSPWGSGLNLSRPHFDLTMSTKAEDSGVSLFKSARLRTLSNDADWLFEMRVAGETSSLKAKFAVDCSGRAAWLLRSMHLKPNRLDKTLGMVNYCQPRTSLSACDPRVLIESALNGWWYTVPLADGRIATTFLTDVDQLSAADCTSAEFWCANLKQTNYTRRRVKLDVPIKDFHVKPAQTQIAPQVAGRNWLAVGDAACALDPLSGQGISKALRDGIFGARAINDWLNGKSTPIQDHNRKHDKAATSYLRQRTYFYNLIPDSFNSHFWRRRRKYVDNIKSNDRFSR